MNLEQRLRESLVAPDPGAVFTARVMARMARGRKRRGRRFIVIGALVAVAAAAAVLSLQTHWSPTPVAATLDRVQVGPAEVEASATPVLSQALPLPKETMSEEESKAYEEWTRRVVEWLAMRDDPDALLTAAMLSTASTGDAPSVQSLLQRATKSAPESARIHAVGMLICLKLKSCDTTPYAQALRRIAPDNALGWAQEVDRSLQADDQEALKSALTAMSRAKTFDQYWNPSIVSMSSQISAALVAPPDIVGSDPPFSSHEVAVGAVAAMPIPGIRSISKVCRAATDENMLLQCRQIGIAMQEGDTLLANSIGLSVSGYGLPADSAEARSLALQKNQLRWINQEVGKLSALSTRYLDLLANHPREVDAIRAFLEAQGIPVEPPAGWKP